IIIIGQNSPAALSGLKEVTDDLPFLQPIKGMVTDSSGHPLSGATITIKGAAGSIQSDANGLFEMDVTRGNILVISYIGYETATIKINNQERVNVRLSPVQREMDQVDVVHTGYQQLPR